MISSYTSCHSFFSPVACNCASQRAGVFRSLPNIYFSYPPTFLTRIRLLGGRERFYQCSKVILIRVAVSTSRLPSAHLGNDE